MHVGMHLTGIIMVKRRHAAFRITFDRLSTQRLRKVICVLPFSVGISGVVPRVNPPEWGSAHSRSQDMRTGAGNHEEALRAKNSYLECAHQAGG